MSDIIPSFIKVYTLGLSNRVRFEGSTGDKVYLPATLSKSVEIGGGDVPEGYVVLSVLGKGVKSTDDSVSPPMRYFGTKLSKITEDGNSPLEIGVGSNPDAPITTGLDLVIPRFTRFSTNTSWK